MTATTATAAPRRSRKLLLPLATLVAASGIAFASGASFTTATASTGLAASGTLTQTNSNSVAFSRENLKPGDVVTGSVTIDNDGSLPAWFTITERQDSNTFVNKSLLTLKIADGATVVYEGPLGAAGAKAIPTAFPAKTSRTYDFTVTLSADAGNAEQGKRAATTYIFSSTQAAPSTFSGTQGGSVTTTTTEPVTPQPIPTMQVVQPAQ